MSKRAFRQMEYACKGFFRLLVSRNQPEPFQNDLLFVAHLPQISVAHEPGLL